CRRGPPRALRDRPRCRACRRAARSPPGCPRRGSLRGCLLRGAVVDVLEGVPVEVEDAGGEIAAAVFRADPGLPLGPCARGERRMEERVDRALVGGGRGEREAAGEVSPDDPEGARLAGAAEVRPPLVGPVE